LQLRKRRGAAGRVEAPVAGIEHGIGEESQRLVPPVRCGESDEGND
jgi:hypothetical protein